MDKIAIKCISLEEVQNVINNHPCFYTNAHKVWNNSLKQDGVICINSSSNGWNSETYFEKKGYRIIEADEYLQEGAERSAEGGREMSKLLSKVLAESRHADAELVKKHSAKIIGSMQDTTVNMDILENIGAEKLIQMAKNIEEAEAEKSE